MEYYTTVTPNDNDSLYIWGTPTNENFGIVIDPVTGNAIDGSTLKFTDANDGFTHIGMELKYGDKPRTDYIEYYGIKRNTGKKLFLHQLV